MPRTLPWLLSQNDDARVKRESTRPQNPVKSETDQSLPSSPTKRDFLRSSRTPPSSPIRQCPAEEFIIEGLDNDDAWIMVEDEFYAVAQSFTQHLHYAEYVRRIKEVKAQKAMGMEEHERPTDDKTAIPRELQRKKEAEALDARQKVGLQEIVGANDEEKDDTEDDDLWAGTHLHDLMASPRQLRSLMSVHVMKSSTRAAAGFGHASVSNSGARTASRGEPMSSSRAEAAQRMEINEETASDEDDDLDLQANPIPMPSPKRTGDAAARNRSNNRWWTHESHSERKASSTSTSKIPKKSAPTRTSNQSANRSKSKVQMLFDDLDELPEPSRHGLSISDRKRDSPSTRETPSANNNLDPKKSRHDDVPTFSV